MTMLTLTDDNFYETMADHEGYLLVDFWAKWCAPCRMLMPVLEELDAEGFPVGRVDIDTNPDLTLAMQIKSIPTMILFFEGKPVHRITGVKSKQSLLEELGQFK